jgi:hypothetical protein
MESWEKRLLTRYTIPIWQMANKVLEELGVENQCIP